MSFHIMGGRFKGRAMKSVRHPGLRVTTGAVREAVFSSLADDVSGSDFIDLYAGCGSVGLEALSRGAASVTWVEQVRRLTGCIRANIDLVIPSASPAAETAVLQVVQGKVEKTLVRLETGGKQFDFIFADPPYGHGLAAGFVDVGTLDNILRKEGVLVVEHTLAENLPEKNGLLSLVKTRRFGKSKLSFFRFVK